MRLVAVLLMLGLSACTTRAIRSASLETQARPDDAAAWVALGDALAEAARPSQAQQAYAQALAIDPENEAAHAGASKVQGGASRLERRAQRNPMDDEIWGDLGDQYAMLGRVEDAKNAYRRAFQLDPMDSEWQGALAGLGESVSVAGVDGVVGNDDEILGDRADAFRNMGNWTEACDLYRQAAALDPADTEWTQWIVTCDVGIPGGVPMADESVEALESRLNGNLQLLLALGRAHAKAGDADQAETYLRGALLLAPGNRTALRTYLAITGRDARSVLADLADESGSAEASGALGDLLLELGDRDGAKKAWEQAVERADDGNRWTELLELLELKGVAGE